MESSHSEESESSLSEHELISENKYSDDFDTFEPEKVSDEEILIDAEYLNSPIGELTESNDLFDTFEPEELDSEQVLKETNQAVKKEIVSEMGNQLDLFDTFEPHSIFNEKTENEAQNKEKNESYEQFNNQNLDLTKNEDKTGKLNYLEKPEGEGIYDEAVNAVFGLKKESDIDTWARGEAEAMSERAAEGARVDVERKYGKKDIYSSDEKNKFEKKSNNSGQLLKDNFSEFSNDQKKSSENFNTNDKFNKNRIHKNVKPSMKDLKNDLQSLSEFINSSTNTLKNSDPEGK